MSTMVKIHKTCGKCFVQSQKYLFIGLKSDKLLFSYFKSWFQKIILWNDGENVAWWLILGVGNARVKVATLLFIL